MMIKRVDEKIVMRMQGNLNTIMDLTDWRCGKQKMTLRFQYDELDYEKSILLMLKISVFS